MLTIVGFLVVIVAVIGGYLLEHGNIQVLLQPAELLIIGGASVGALVIANPLRVMRSLSVRLLGLFRPDQYGRAQHLDTLKLLYDLFMCARKEGAARLEAHIERPLESPVFSEHPAFLKNQHALTYLSDTLRVVLMGGVAAHEIEQLMEVDSESHHGEASEPVSALQMMADSLPGLGIVAAVLGVVITMGALGGPPSEIGHKVAAALVGTFLGVLLCYGFVGPLGARLQKVNEAEAQYFLCLKHGMIAYVRGSAPILAVEFARRSIPPHIRPSFEELETVCRGATQPAAAAAEAA